MKVGIIGYGAMGSIMCHQMLNSGCVAGEDMYVANRTYEKMRPLEGVCNLCRSNTELAAVADVIFVFVEPNDIPIVLTEIKDVVGPDTLVVSPNAIVPLDILEEVYDRKIAKIVPSVTAGTGHSQTLVSFNDLVPEEDKVKLKALLACMGDVFELKEDEMFMGAELTSCMPGFIGAIFDVFCQSAARHLPFSEEQIYDMVTGTLYSTSEMIVANHMGLNEVVRKVATPGGITEEGAKAIYANLPDVADKAFEVTLAKRAKIVEKARKK